MTKSKTMARGQTNRRFTKSIFSFVKSQPKSKADREYSASDEKVFFERIASILLKKDHFLQPILDSPKQSLRDLQDLITLLRPRLSH